MGFASAEWSIPAVPDHKKWYKNNWKLSTTPATGEVVYALSVTVEARTNNSPMYDAYRILHSHLHSSLSVNYSYYASTWPLPCQASDIGLLQTSFPSMRGCVIQLMVSLSTHWLWVSASFQEHVITGKQPKPQGPPSYLGSIYKSYWCRRRIQ